DLTWFKLDGTEIVDQQWSDPEVRSMAMRLGGEAIDEREPEGGRISDETLLVLLNAYHQALEFRLPDSGGVEGSCWELLMDTTDAAVVDITDEDETLILRLLGYLESPIANELRQRIYALFSPEQSRIDEVCEVNVLIGEAFAISATLALRRAGVQADLIASHG